MTPAAQLVALAVSMSLLTVHAAVGGDPLPRATPESVGLAAAPLGQATDLLKQFVSDHKAYNLDSSVERRQQVKNADGI